MARLGAEIEDKDGLLSSMSATISIYHCINMLRLHNVFGVVDRYAQSKGVLRLAFAVSGKGEYQ